MSTSVAIEKIESGATARQAELTAQLKQWTARVSVLSDERAQITGKIYRAVYEWIGIALVRKTAKTAEDGAARLGDTLKKKSKSISNYYYFGKFMADHDLDADRCESGAVRALYNSFGFLSKADQLRALQVVKGGGEGKDVGKIVGKSPLAAQRRAHNRVESLAKQRKLTLQRLRLEMRALKTMAIKFYGIDEIQIHIVKNGAPEEVV